MNNILHSEKTSPFSESLHRKFKLKCLNWTKCIGSLVSFTAQATRCTLIGLNVTKVHGPDASRGCTSYIRVLDKFIKLFTPIWHLACGMEVCSRHSNFQEGPKRSRRKLSSYLSYKSACKDPGKTDIQSHFWIY